MAGKIDNSEMLSSIKILILFDSTTRYRNNIRRTSCRRMDDGLWWEKIREFPMNYETIVAG